MKNATVISFHTIIDKNRNWQFCRFLHLKGKTSSSNARATTLPLYSQSNFVGRKLYIFANDFASTQGSKLEPWHGTVQVLLSKIHWIVIQQPLINLKSSYTLSRFYLPTLVSSQSSPLAANPLLFTPLLQYPNSHTLGQKFQPGIHQSLSLSQNTKLIVGAIEQLKSATCQYRKPQRPQKRSRIL